MKKVEEGRKFIHQIDPNQSTQFLAGNNSFKLSAYNSCYIACWQILILVTQSSVVMQYCLAGSLLSTRCTKRNSHNTQATSNHSSTPFTPVPVTARQSTSHHSQPIGTCHKYNVP